ncbi:VOC family protein [Desulfobacterales bacterium HSG17]|nr:VOC family protein [Desulfobacterales bacterium HSG17]
MDIKGIHHVAIICSDYKRSKKFYTQILNFKILDEHFRQERNSYKLDLAINRNYRIELFSFHQPPKRVNMPEAAGLRHLALAVSNLDKIVKELNDKGVVTEAIRIDPYTGCRYTFCKDPDGLPLEFYEQ